MAKVEVWFDGDCPLCRREIAGEIFGEGRLSEEEGERLLREREYDAAQLAFSRAARLFQQAQELTWEVRIRRADLAPAR